MTTDVAAAIYDHLVPDWREAPRNGANRRVHALYREDKNASVDIHETKLTWYDRGIGEGGGAVDFARRTGCRRVRKTAGPARSMRHCGNPLRESSRWVAC